MDIIENEHGRRVFFGGWVSFGSIIGKELD